MTNYLVSPQKAAKELYIRRRARESVHDYSNAIQVPGKPTDEDPDSEFFKEIETPITKHHKLILDTMEEISSKPYGRAMLFMPPGSAKSTYASVVFPSKYLGAEAGKRLILSSYGDDLARKMGRRTRSVIKQKRYKKIFNTELSADSKAAESFTLTNGSEYMACGILSGITGNRANGIIIDDPVKGREQANSEAIRKKTWEAYEDDLKTRLVPGGWMAIIMTRWHEDDLAGRILPTDWNGESGDILCKDGNVWKVLCLQALCEVDNDPIGRKKGEYLWPEWFDLKHWQQHENSPITWNALFQQRPAPLEGGFMKPANIMIVDELPKGDITWVRGWDFAASLDGDYTTGSKIGKLSDGRFIIGDMYRKQVLTDERDDALLSIAGLDGKEVKISIPQDPGQAGKSQVLYLTRKLEGYSVESSPESGDKITRAEPFASQINAGNVLMLRGNWNQQFIDEARMFPNGSYDDQIDASSRAFNKLLSVHVRKSIEVTAPPAMANHW